MKRLLLALAIAALALPANALGKGATAAMLEGPGADGSPTPCREREATT